MAFELKNAQVKLTSVNTRIEKHGEENKLAADLDFTYETANTNLAMFAPDLRSCLYKTEDDQVQGTLVQDADYKPVRRFPAISAIKWAGNEIIGGELVFHYGVKTQITFGDIKVHKYRIELKEGGSVVIHFQTQVHPNEQQSGKLAKLLEGGVCEIDVTPPGEDAQQEE